MGSQVGTVRAGRPHSPGTVLASVMRQRDVKMFRVSAALGVSHSTVYRFLKRTARLSPLQVVQLCELLDMEPEELVGAEGLLLTDKGNA